jgi:hypothetical protein
VLISVVYITNRPPDCVESGPTTNQYQLLSDALRRQTLPAERWEVVVVAAQGDVPRPELAWCETRVRYVRPRATPWGSAFNPASPRNDGLAAARGEVIFGLDDRVTFGPRLLEGVAQYAAQGMFLAPVWKTPRQLRTGGQVVPVELCGGDLAYPREVAISVGGHPEEFAGTLAFEDWSFSKRMSKAGCEFVCDPNPELHITAYKGSHTQRPGMVRCCYAVRELSDAHAHSNQPWTPEEIEHAFAGPTCGFDRGGCCTITRRACAQQNRPSAETVAIMRTYESAPWRTFAP